MANDKLQAALDILEKGIQSLINSERWLEFLKFQSAFHNYSFGNQVLIWAQMPTASRVAGFGTWKKLGRFVKKGEKSIKILAPMEIKVHEEDENGNEVEKKVRIYRPVSVFDLSQTDGKPLPRLVERLEGDFELYVTLKELCPFLVSELDSCGGANGYYHLKEKSIAILVSLSEAHKTKTLIHEWCHGLLHDQWIQTKEEDRPDSQTMEIEAESTAFVVCHHLGLDTSSYSFGYVAGWAGGDDVVGKLRKSGERIQKVSDEILREIIGVLESEEEVLQVT